MNLIFDFDGTICDSFDLTVKIANEYLTRFKKKVIDPTEFREKGIEEIIKDYKLSKLQILIYIYKGRRELATHMTELKVFPGMAEVIKELAISNRLAVVSSNSKKNIEKFLVQNKLDKYFDFIYSSPTIFNKAKKIERAIVKYKLNKDETIYIGDEVRDIDAARRANLKCISVAWGFA